MNFGPLRNLLAQPYSADTCKKIAYETSILYREDNPNRWYFLLLFLIFFQVITNSELYDADRSAPFLDVLFRQSLEGLSALEGNNLELLILSANQLSEAYSGIL